MVLYYNGTPYENVLTDSLEEADTKESKGKNVKKRLNFEQSTNNDKKPKKVKVDEKPKMSKEKDLRD